MRNGLSLLFLWGLAACATAGPYDFRDGYRPHYARTVSAEQLGDLRNDVPVALLDVRLPEDRAADPVLNPGAEYRNPDEIAAWSRSVPAGATVVVYCVRGRWVSQKAAAYLAERGVEVYSLDGGIAAWKQRGLPLE